MSNENKNSNGKIVRVDIVDNEPERESERLLDTFYLIDPDRELLNKLQEMIDARYEDGGIDDYCEIYDFIDEHFTQINIDKFEIEW